MEYFIFEDYNNLMFFMTNVILIKKNLTKFLTADSLFCFRSDVVIGVSDVLQREVTRRRVRENGNLSRN